MAVVQNIVATRMWLHKSVALWGQVAVEPIAATPSRQTAIGDCAVECTLWAFGPVLTAFEIWYPLANLGGSVFFIFSDLMYVA